MRKLFTAALLAAVSFTGESVQAQTASPYQSPARPYGLNIAAPVQLAGSDAASANFQANYLSGMLTLINERLGERVPQHNVSTLALDPAKLTLSTEAAVRVYFLGEGAGYRNSLGFNTLTASMQPGSGIVNGLAKLIFANASTPANGSRTMQDPLLAGDFVDLGTKAAGSLLDFFLIANGAYGNGNVFTANTARNADNTPHVVSFVVANSPYLIIGFEDLWNGGDKDYNDLVFAVNIGAQNVKNLISAPEPATLLTMSGFLGVALCSRCRARYSLTLA